MPSPNQTHKESYPLVRLSLILPFVLELNQRGKGTDRILQESGISPPALENHSLFVPANLIYGFCENAAKASKDHFLGSCVGEKLQFTEWSPLVEAIRKSHTLQGFLTKFILSAKTHASSVTYEINIGQNTTFFKQIRVKVPEIIPSQVDAFTAAYVINLLRKGAGLNWDPGMVKILVSDPSALPARYQGISVMAGDRCGVVTSFPSAWLSAPIKMSKLEQLTRPVEHKNEPPKDFVSVLRDIINLHIDRSDITASYFASLFGVSEQTLQRKLHSKGTSLKKEILRLKKIRACSLLVETDYSVSHIGYLLGYDRADSFTRAFKSWTDESPSDYRDSKQKRTVC